jgi:hypothetical protein
MLLPYFIKDSARFLEPVSPLSRKIPENSPSSLSHLGFRLETATILTLKILWRNLMAKGKNKKAQQLGWRSKKANHGKKPASSR